MLLSREARTSDSVKALNSLCRIRLLQRRDDPGEDRAGVSEFAGLRSGGEFGGEFALSKSGIDVGEDRLRRSISLYFRQIV